jgi:hypothetical protein
MKVLIEILKAEPFDGSSAYSVQIEGTPQYCSGYCDALEESPAYKGMSVVKQILDN